MNVRLDRSTGRVAYKPRAINGVFVLAFDTPSCFGQLSICVDQAALAKAGPHGSGDIQLPFRLVCAPGFKLGDHHQCLYGSLGHSQDTTGMTVKCQGSGGR